MYVKKTALKFQDNMIQSDSRTRFVYTAILNRLKEKETTGESVSQKRSYITKINNDQGKLRF